VLRYKHAGTNKLNELTLFGLASSATMWFKHHGEQQYLKNIAFTRHSGQEMIKKARGSKAGSMSVIEGGGAVMGEWGRPFGGLP
jgi:hypothetical protein